MASTDPQNTASHHASRATSWQLRTRRLSFAERPLWMGIINVTPDSFSDGGRCCRPEQAVQQGLQLVAEGADILDIGGESTRPYSQPVAAQEQWQRVGDVVGELCQRVDVPISIDTSKASVARQALQAGVEIINDVTGLTGDPEMIQVAIEYQAGVCAMHMQGTPQTMQDNPVYDDVVREIYAYLGHRRDGLREAGIAAERICLDPGIGFGKTHQHNLTLLAHCADFHQLGCPLLVGHSRKAFIGKVLQDRSADRCWGNVGVALALARQGVQVMRVHAVAPLHQAWLLFEAAGGMDGCSWR